MRERAIDRVRKLMAKAASTSFAPEAEACQAKALELCRKYRLTEAELAPPAPPAVVVRPAWSGVFINGFPAQAFSMWDTHQGQRIVFTNGMRVTVTVNLRFN